MRVVLSVPGTGCGIPSPTSITVKSAAAMRRFIVGPPSMISSLLRTGCL
jgi:hypothetical protein